MLEMSIRLLLICLMKRVVVVRSAFEFRRGTGNRNAETGKKILTAY